MENERKIRILWGVADVNVTIRNNRIYNNSDQGINVLTEFPSDVVRGVTISQNSMYNNGHLGIDLGQDDISVNDNGDIDAGPNDLLNAPIVEAIRLEGVELVVRGFAPPGAMLELFIADTDPNIGLDMQGGSGAHLGAHLGGHSHGEGQVYLATMVEGGTGAGGADAYADQYDDTLLGQGSYGGADCAGGAPCVENRFEFRIPVGASPVLNGQALVFPGEFTLTATDAAGNTSEFSGVQGLDTDEDGVFDETDIDSDNDGILNVDELGGLDPRVDCDMDGVFDFEDAFDNTDPDLFGPAPGLCAASILPVFVDGTCPDVDGDFRCDCTDADADGRCDTGCPDLPPGPMDPPDGVCDVLSEAIDWDGDGIPNHLDLDSDNDGIPDLIENAASDTLDDNHDGILDDADPNDDGNYTDALDVDGDGLIDTVDDTTVLGANSNSILPVLNTDATGGPDYLDLDADADGLSDLFETGGSASADVDQDGVIDATADADEDGLDDSVDPTVAEETGGTPGTAWPTPDSNGDGEFDFQDSDADGDTVVDAIEGHDADADGDVNGAGEEIDAAGLGVDSDADGIDDAYDVHCAAAADCGGVIGVPATLASVPNFDAAADNVPDYRDVDDDNDGIPSAIEVAESNIDPNGNGHPNYLDTDSDGDGIVDAVEGHDVDGDGDVDSPDLGPANQDANGNGIDDAYDAACVLATDCGGVFGVSPVPPNHDTDAFPDYVDVDDDGDGILTSVESTDPVQNPDGDNTPNYLDINSDGDSEDDIIEGHDDNGDGVVDSNDSNQFANQDDNQNGIDDALDPACIPASPCGSVTNGVAASTPNVDGGALTPDYLEAMDGEGRIGGISGGAFDFACALGVPQSNTHVPVVCLLLWWIALCLWVWRVNKPCRS